MSKYIELFLSLFYIGNNKYAPGTLASIFTAILFFWFPNIFSYKIILLLVIYGIASFFCYKIYDKLTDKDPQFIVIDESIGMIIALLLVPPLFFNYLLAIILFRSFDILKPSIIKRIENVNYGQGILLDDVLSGFITLLIMYNIV